METQTPEISLKQKIDEGVACMSRLTAATFEYSRTLLKSDAAVSDDRAVARGFLITSGQLAGQIAQAILRGQLTLAIIGHRTLLQLLIDANYIFDHPDHRGDQKWVGELCRDMIDRSNNPKAQKTKLGGVTVKNRALAIRRPDLYDQNYSGLSDYSHLVVRSTLLNRPEMFSRYSVVVMSQSLCHLYGVLDSVDVFFERGLEDELKSIVISYRDRYESVLS